MEILNLISKDPTCCPITTPPVPTVYIRYGYTLAFLSVSELSSSEIDPNMIALGKLEKHDVTNPNPGPQHTNTDSGLMR